MASIIKSGKGWRAQLHVCGVRESVCFEKKSDAAAWAGSREKELRESLKSAGAPITKERRKFLELSELYSEAKIVSTAFSAKSSAGVYFLIRDDRIVYVGKSVNVHARIATHQKEKQFDKINFIECSVECLHRLEQMYIRKFNPELNIAGRNDHLPQLEGVEWQA